MSKTIAISIAATLFGIGMISHASVASATPVSDALAIKNAAPNNLETVQWRRGGYRGGYRSGWRGGRRGYYGGGFAAGAILGGLLAAPYYYYPGPYYYSDPGYYYGPPPGDAVGYCMQRFKSYDPGSGTYLGYDGYRHPCP
jgi:MFS family permease